MLNILFMSVNQSNFVLITQSLRDMIILHTAEKNLLISWCLPTKSAFTEQNNGPCATLMMSQPFSPKICVQLSVDISMIRQTNPEVYTRINMGTVATVFNNKNWYERNISTLMSDEVKYHVNLFFLISASFSFSLFLSFFTMLLLWSCCFDNFSPASENVILLLLQQPNHA